MRKSVLGQILRQQWFLKTTMGEGIEHVNTLNDTKMKRSKRHQFEARFIRGLYAGHGKTLH